ncbi:ammonia-forming cytochrome c nitrite reductase subunit c552 [Geobacter benzoatilyticus]|jgi:nitrite reductase (cytochrome c-552)|uniref:nitrite reductase (cytochrome; ammonia-forming) n=1 Tax=Geobacter benzoatilyticus TaxID=2815309 RepID=A0ABX7Q7N6_9BACT|nr:ammonia-forming cytochrome c nitrite reductase subunit c552 [Geobacter benzoatilyticus]QSV47063.1 ammonia-forming cytochrome c nitrite reductase subunit c552 [Geobacter benzoatilyticus]
MKKRSVKRWSIATALAAAVAAMVLAVGCTPKKIEQGGETAAVDGTIDPAEWGKDYPLQYGLWKKTGESTPAGLSKYKKGNDGERIDKLDEYPFLALLYNGWGMGVEYTEPRGHLHMIEDQLEIDPSRYKAGGTCLTCKTPYAPVLQQRMGKDYFSKPYKEVLAQIPKEHQTLGVACIDCHNNRDMSLKYSRGFTLGKALDQLGVDQSKLSQQDMRSLVCAQCHVTYSIPKDADMKSTGVFFPWQGSKWGGITIENIIKQLRNNPPSGEWTQSVTGFKMAFIRHPEFEFFSNNSVHWQAGVSCADCHMPSTTAGNQQVTDHRIMSPLKNDLGACRQCHSESPEQLREKVYSIQDKTMSRFIRTGYATATVAKLFEMANKAQAAGRQIDQNLYAKARDHYEEAFYRVVFISAENSTGFHNPAEALRILADAAGHAGKADGLLRQALAGAGVNVPATVDLELAKYVNNRGAKKLMFKPEHEIKDPLPAEKY